MNYSPGPLGNVMSRLQGLKNVSRRKVMPGEGILKEKDEYENDVSGTAQPMPDFATPVNPEIGQGGIPSQSDDVRANAEINPSKEEDEQGFFSKLGSSLASMVQSQVQPGTEPQNAMQQQPEQEPGYLDQAGSWLKKSFTPSTLEEINAQKAAYQAAQQEPGYLSRFGNWVKDGFTPSSPEEIRARQQESYQRLGRSLPQNRAPEQTAPAESLGALPGEEQLPTEQTAIDKRYQPVPYPEASPGIMGAISDYLSPKKRGQMHDYNQDVLTNAQIRAQGKNPEEVRSSTHEALGADVEKAMENPGQFAAYGSAEQVGNNPALSATFKEITGTNFEPQLAAQVAEHELAMKGVEDALNGVNTQLDARSEGIKQRILNNQSTDQDKYYIGLALLMPLLVGGMFGKEAALGALSGGMQGVSKALGQRQKDIRSDENSLLDLSKQQSINQEKLANIALGKAKLGPELRKQIPEESNKHLHGMQGVEWVDENTGETMKGVRLKPGLVAKAEYVNSPLGKKDMMKAANELSTMKTYVDDVNDLTDDIASIVSQLDDPTAMWKGFTQMLTKANPTALSKLSQDVMFEGRMQNAGTLLEQKLGFLANKYGMAQDLGQLDRAAQAHIKKIIENPTNSFISPQDSLNQILEVRKLAQRGLMQSAENQGFYPEFVMESQRQRNNRLIGGLNQKEDDKVKDDITKKLMQSEQQYAK